MSHCGKCRAGAAHPHIRAPASHSSSGLSEYVLSAYNSSSAVPVRRVAQVHQEPITNSGAVRYEGDDHFQLGVKFWHLSFECE